MKTNPPATASTDSDGYQQLSSIFPQIGQLFRDFAEQKHIPGMAVGIVMDGELAYSTAFGVRNVVENAPVTSDSVFRIASMTKSITAMCLIKLRDEGKLRLDDPVSEYVPELSSLRYPTTDSTAITVRQLLTMSAGFPQDDPWADRQLAIAEADLTDWLSGGLSFSNPPGMIFEYSNYGYAILGRIVTNVSGIPYQVYATSSILEPLGMTSSTFDIGRVPADRLAMGYRLEANQWIEEPPLPDGAFASIGGLFTTIPDFARYMAFLLSGFPPCDDPERGPVRRSSLREMQQPWRQSGIMASRATPDASLLIQSDGYGYGLGCGIDSVLGYSVYHGGGLPGYGSFYRLLPDSGVGVVAFTNLTYSAPRNAVNDGLAILRKTLKPSAKVPSSALQVIQESIARLYERWDDAEATSIATDSFFLDMPLDKRREQFERLRTDLGTCLSLTTLEPENRLRGRWTMNCKHGKVELFITLAPTIPPRLQYLQLTVAKAVSPKLRNVTVRLTRLMRTWDDVQFKSLFSHQLKRSQIRAQLEALNAQYGPLKLTDVLESDGQTSGRFRLTGKRGIVDMRVVVEPRSGKIREIAFTKPRETAFML
jgi:CubicO group peptidase (beta-lactamase class C family)